MSHISGKIWTISVQEFYKNWLRTSMNSLLESLLVLGFCFLQQLLECRGKPGRKDENLLGLCQYLKQAGKVKVITWVLVSES